MANFGERLARLIHERGWTQVEAAEKLGVSQALISHYLSGKREPLPRTISHLAERLGVTDHSLTAPYMAQLALAAISSGETQ